MRPIDADALVAWLENVMCEFPDPAFKRGVEFVRKAVSNENRFPALEYAPVRHGELVNLGFLTCKCSLCETTFHDLPAENFCPNCGAKMDGGKSE